MENDVIIDLREIFFAVKKKILLVCIVGILGGVIGFFATKTSQKPLYEAELSLIVRNTTDELETITSADITASHNLAMSGAYVVKSEQLLNKIITKLNLDLSYEELASTITTTRISGTQVIVVNMIYEDPDIARSVLEKVAEYIPSIFRKQLGGGSCKSTSGVTVSLYSMSSNPKSGAMIGAFLGAFFVLAIVVLKELLDDRVKSEEQFVEKINVPVLGMLPATKEEGVVLLNQEKIPFKVSESYKVLMANFNNFSTKENYRKIMITSFGEEEGKKTIALNLAMTLEKFNQEVLVLECDFKNPKMNEIFQIEKTKSGFSALLSGMCKLEDCLVKIPNSSVMVLPAGSIISNSSDLLIGKRMEEILADLEEKFDYIIMDVPAMIKAADAICFRNNIDAAIFIVKHNHTNINLVKASINSLQKAGIKLMGAILNEVDDGKGKKGQSWNRR